MNDKEWYAIGLDTSGFKRQAQDARNEFTQIGNTAYSQSMKVDSLANSIGGLFAATLGVGVLSSFTRQIVQVRGEIQQLEISFETMLGSKSKADALMAQLIDTAARTPFQLTDVAAGAKSLLAYGSAAEDVNGTLVKLGDIAAGLSIPLGDLVYLYGTTMTQGRLYTQDLNQFSGRGIPMIKELAKQFGVAENAVKGLVEAGKVGFPEVEKVINSLTGESGKFFNLMAKQSESVTGQISNLRDNVDQMMNNIGKGNEGAIYTVIGGLNSLVANYEKVGKTIFELIAVYGTYKAVLITISALNKLNMMVVRQAVLEKRLAAAASIQLSNAEAIAAARTKLLTIAQNGLVASLKATKAAFLANPYVLAAAAVAGLAYGIYKLVTAETAAEKAHKAYNDELKRGKEAKQNLISKTDELISVINSETQSLYARIKAYEELQKQFPKLFKGMDIEQFQSFSSKEIQIKINTEVDRQELENFESDYKNTLERIKKLEADYDIASGTDESGIRLKQIANKIEAEKEILKLQKEQLDNAERIRKEAEFAAKPNSEKIEYYNTELESLKKQKAEIEDMLLKSEDLTGEWGKFTVQSVINAGKLDDLNKKIDETSGKIENLTGTKQQVQNKSYWEKEKKNAQESLDAMTAAQKGSKEWNDALKKYREAENKLKIYDFSDNYKKQLEEKKKAQQEQLKAEEDFKNKQLSVERELQSSRIALMKEGAEKQQAEADQAHQERLDKIKQQQQAALEAYNAKLGFEIGDKGYKTELPKEDIAKFDELRINSEKQKNAEIIKINSDAANEIKEIWNTVSDAFKSDQQKEIDAVNEKYNEITKKSGVKVGSEDFFKIQEARAKETNEIIVKYGLERIEFEKELSLKSIEIGESKFQTEIQIEKKKANALKKAAREQIALLKKLGTQQSEEQIKQLEQYINEVDKGIEKLSSKNALDNFSQALEFADQLTDKLKETLGLSDEQAKVLEEGMNAMQGIAKIASGDVIGGTMQVVMAAIEMFIQAPEKLSERYKALEEQVNKVISSANIANKTLQNLGKVDTTLNTAIISSGLKTVAKDAKDLNKQLEGITGNKVRRGSTSVIYGAEYQKLKTEVADLEQEIEKLATRLLTGDISDEQRTAIESTINAYNNLINQMDNLTNQLIGTNVSELGNSIVEAFLSGEDAAEAWGNKVDSIIKKVIVDQLTASVLSKPLQAAVEQLIKDMDDGLSADEALKFKNTVGSVINDVKPAIDAVNKSFQEIGFTFSETAKTEQKGLTGAIKSITEETASIIAGQFFAMRVELKSIAGNTGYNVHLEAIDENTKQATDYLMQGLALQQQIVENTSYNRKLEPIYDELQSMNKLMKERL